MTKSVIFGVIFLIAGSGFASADQGVQRPVGGNLIHAQAVVAPESTKRIARLSETLQIAGILSVMRQEGFDYGKTLEEDMFPGKGGASWNAAVDKIYDEQAMRTVFDKALFSELGQADAATLGAIEDFFGSERGQRILTLEVEARRALLDPETCVGRPRYFGAGTAGRAADDRQIGRASCRERVLMPV